MEMIRLQKYIALCGIASRRAAEELISAGRVTVNGLVVGLGTKVGSVDTVEVDGKRISSKEDFVYILIYKPMGYVTTARDQFGRPTVIDLVKTIDSRIYPVGRLDYHTSGVLLLTNDGELTYALTHPKHEVKKVYIATVMGTPSKEKMTQFTAGVNIGDYTTAPCHAEWVESFGDRSRIRVSIHEGKNRQIRKMFEAIGNPVIALHRESIGELNLGSLQEGQYRELTDKEVAYLKSIGRNKK